jgi:hypothetical protein
MDMGTGKGVMTGGLAEKLNPDDNAVPKSQETVLVLSYNDATDEKLALAGYNFLGRTFDQQSKEVRVWSRGRITV